MPIGDRAYSVTSITPDMLANEPSQRLENALRLVPGLQQFRRSDARSANPTSQGVTLRGLGGNASSRALMILDGVPQSDPFGGWISFPGYDALNLASVRVRRGGGTGGDGPGALAGTIELTSAGVRPDQSNVYADLAYGSRDSLEASVGTTQALGGGGLSISAQYARGDGFVPIIAGQRGLVDRAAPYEQASVTMRFVAPINAETELQANARAFTDRRERGFAFSDNANDGADASLMLVGQRPLGVVGAGLCAVAQFREQLCRDQRGQVHAPRNRWTSITCLRPASARGWKSARRWARGSSCGLGGEWRRTVGETRELFTFVAGNPTRMRRAGGASDTLGAFAEASWQASPDLLLTGGGRIDHWQLSDGKLRETVLATGAPLTTTDFADRNGWEGTGTRRALHGTQRSLLTLRGAGYLGWRLPTLNELYRPFRVGPDATAANAALAPERLQGVELGLDYEIFTHPAWRYACSGTGWTMPLPTSRWRAGPAPFPASASSRPQAAFSQRQNLECGRGARASRLEARADIGDFDLAAAYSFVDADGQRRRRAGSDRWSAPRAGATPLRDRIARLVSARRRQRRQRRPRAMSGRSSRMTLGLLRAGRCTDAGCARRAPAQPQPAGRTARREPVRYHRAGGDQRPRHHRTWHAAHDLAWRETGH